MKLSDRTKSRITLFILFLIFDAGILAIAKISPGLRLDAFTWVMLVSAASLGGAGIAYLVIGDWIRWPLTKEVPHSSSAEMTEVVPKYEGWLKSPGVLLSCPVCAGTWVGAGLLGLMAWNYDLGYIAVATLATGGAARVMIRLAELVEWQSRYAQERVAELNRRNGREEADQHTKPYIISKSGETHWVVKEEKADE